MTTTPQRVARLAGGPFDRSAFLAERFHRAEAAAAALQIPLPWLKSARRRVALRVPHYVFEKQVRYRLPELAQWMRRHVAEGGLDA